MMYICDKYAPYVSEKLLFSLKMYIKHLISQSDNSAENDQEVQEIIDFYNELVYRVQRPYGNLQNFIMILILYF